MMKRNTTDRLFVFLLLLSGIFITIGILNLRDRIRWNDPFDGMTFLETDQGVVVDGVTSTSLLGQVQPGDLLLRINQHEILNKGDYTELLFLFTPGDTVRYHFKDRLSGDVKEIPVVIQQKPVISIDHFFRSVVAFVYLTIGLLVLFRYRHARSSIHFFLVCLFSFSLYLYSYTNKLTLLDYTVQWISLTSFLLLPALFLHFCLNFPIHRRWIRGSVLTILYIYLPFIVLLGIQILWFAKVLTPLGLAVNLSNYVFLTRIQFIYFALFFMSSLVVLFHNRISLGSPELRQQMKWIVNGTTVALVPFSCFYILPHLLNLEVTPLMQASILSLIFIPLTFAYAIMKYRLMDVDIIVKSGAAYLIASAVILGLYFALIGVSSLLLRHLFPNSDKLAIALAALVVAFLFNPIRKRIQEEIDRFFYKEEYKYRQSLIEFGRTLSTESSMKTVTSTILDRVHKSLKVDKAAIFLRRPAEGGEYELVAFAGLPYLPENRSGFRIPEAFLIKGYEVPTLSYEIFEGEGSEWLLSLRDFYEKMSLYYFQPLVHRNEMIGVIALGKGTQDTFLTSEDIDLLNMLGGYAAIALENARLYNSLQNKARELELLKAYSDNIIEGINVGVIALDEHDTVTTWNQAMEQLYGLDYRDAVGKSFSSLFPADVCSSIYRAIGGKSLFSLRTVNIYKLFLESQRGEKKIVNLTTSPFHDAKGQAIGTLLVFDDISAKVSLENQLLQAEKLSSLGLIAAGVAHEVNTPLTGISSFTQMLVQNVPDDHPHHQILKKIEKQCFRASEIVNNLLNFARIQSAEFKEIQLNNLLEESLSLLDHQFRRKQINIAREFEPAVPPIQGNDGQLMQVFINILLNALDATPGGGRIAVRTRNENSSVIVQIEDTGNGIPPEIVHRIYDPFFTTKDTGKGTGLGLSVSYGIIQEHAGRIFVDSQPGQGTCFTIKLPVRQARTQEVAQHESQQQS